MRCWVPENALVTLLRQCYSFPKCHSGLRTLDARRRRDSRSYGTSMRKASLKDPETRDSHGPSTVLQTSSTLPGGTDSSHPRKDKPPHKIAILGGGITGLTSAYYMSIEFPKSEITLYEASGRLGGWLSSKHVDVGNGKVVFEQGPRSIRPNSAAAVHTLNLISHLGLQNEMLITSKESVAAQNRYLYYPDHLVQMPGPGQDMYEVLWRILTEPVFKGAVSGAAMEYFRPRRHTTLDDESVGSYLQRRFGNTHVGDNIVSAIVHGIYAGDIYQLSIKSLLPIAWYYEGEYGSNAKAMTSIMREKRFPIPQRDAALLKLSAERRAQEANEPGVYRASVYSFKQGIGALSDALVAALKKNPKVRVETNHAVSQLSLNAESDKIQVTRKPGKKPTDYDQVISTISGQSLSHLTEGSNDLPSLRNMHAVTVMVVNLYYANPSILPVHGFGYLIPQSIPWEQNPERALGVVFDSDASVGQDTAPGTKVTVMLGGHWWDDWSFYPDEAEAADMAKAVLKRHLKIEEEPEVVNVGLQKKCIPQYTVGHEARMKKTHQDLLRLFKGKLAVAGNSYTGVGLNDCVRAAIDLTQSIRDQGFLGTTGLEQFASEKKFTIMVPTSSPREDS